MFRFFDSSDWTKDSKESCGSALKYGGYAMIIIPTITLFIDFGMSFGINLLLQLITFTIGLLMVNEGQHLLNEAQFTPA